jgi:hypothetical protein
MTPDVSAEAAIAAIHPDLLAVGVIVVAACWTAGGRVRRAFGVSLGVAALVPVWFLPEGYPLVRGVSTLLAFTGTMRVTDLRIGRWSLQDRLVHVASPVDTRRLIRAPARFEGRVIVAGLAWLAIALAANACLKVEVPHGWVVFWLARWGAALLLVYSGVSAGYALIRAAYAALGLQTGNLHAAPMFSRSIDEFWGERWARPVSAWMRDTFFRPWVRRRHPVVGLLLAFAVSGAFHAYVIWVALGLVRGLPMAGLMLAFFLLQSVFAGVERVLGARRWPARWGRVWTVTLTLASAPLFLEPIVRVLGHPPALVQDAVLARTAPTRLLHSLLR